MTMTWITNIHFSVLIFLVNFCRIIEAIFIEYINSQ